MINKGISNWYSSLDGWLYHPGTRLTGPSTLILYYTCNHTSSSMEPLTCVVDNGSYEVRVGFCGDVVPRLIAPNCTARPRQQLRVLVADEIYNIRNLAQLEVTRPLERGILVNAACQRDVWKKRDSFQRPCLTHGHPRNMQTRRPCLTHGHSRNIQTRYSGSCRTNLK